MKKPEGQSFEPGLKKRSARRPVVDWRFTPEDLARLMAAAADRPGRSWCYANTKAAQAKSKATKARNAKARAKAAAEASIAVRKARNRAIRTNGSTARVLSAMAGGTDGSSAEWLGIRDVMALSGVGRKSVCAIVYQRLAPKGLVERTQNPAYSGKGTPWTRWSQGAGKVEPCFLWRITEAGRVIAAQEKSPLRG